MPTSADRRTPRADRIGVVGLGLVGTALCERLCAAGFDVAGCDVDPAQAAALDHLGIAPRPTPADVVADRDTVVLALPDSAAVTRVVDGAAGLLAAPRPPACVIDTTTGDPQAVEAVAIRLGEVGCACFDATISGSSQQVRDGEAVLMVGGDEAAYQARAPVFTALSPRHVCLGPAGSGSRAKLASNLVLGLNRLALAEGLLLAEAIGLDPARFLELLVQTPAYSRQMDTKGPKMVSGAFAPVARLAQHRKDVGLILTAARRAGTDLPVSALHAQLLDAAIAAGDGELDNSAIIRQLRRQAGPAAGADPAAAGGAPSSATPRHDPESPIP